MHVQELVQRARSIPRVVFLLASAAVVYPAFSVVALFVLSWYAPVAIVICGALVTWQRAVKEWALDR